MEARADAAVEGFWNTAYDVDYDVEVSAPDGGINFRSGAGAGEKLLDDASVSPDIKLVRVQSIGRYAAGLSFDD